MKVCVVCCTCDLPARASVRILFSSMGIWMLLLWTARKDSDHWEWWSRACNSIHSGVTKGPTKVSRSLHTISCYSKSVVRNRSIWAAKLACNLRVIEIQIHVRDWMWLAVYAYGTNRCIVSKIWKKYCHLNLSFDSTSSGLYRSFTLLNLPPLVARMSRVVRKVTKEQSSGAVPPLKKPFCIWCGFKTTNSLSNWCLISQHRTAILL